jgi:hypothetical protein
MVVRMDKVTIEEDSKGNPTKYANVKYLGAHYNEDTKMIEVSVSYEIWREGQKLADGLGTKTVEIPVP